MVGGDGIHDALTGRITVRDMIPLAAGDLPGDGEGEQAGQRDLTVLHAHGVADQGDRQGHHGARCQAGQGAQHQQ